MKKLCIYAIIILAIFFLLSCDNHQNNATENKTLSISAYWSTATNLQNAVYSFNKGRL